MKLNNSTEQALAIIAILCTQKDGTPVPSSVITNRLHTSVSYTQKLLRKLVVAQIIEAVPGNNGGFTLKKKPKYISLLHIIEAIEGKIKTYPDYGTFKKAFFEFNIQVQESESIVKKTFSKADLAWREELKSHTVEEVLKIIFQGEIVKINWNEQNSKRSKDGGINKK